MTIIRDPNTQHGQGVNSRGQSLVKASQEDEQLEAAKVGDAYNLNTGSIALTSATESAVMYMKNNADTHFLLKALAVGIGTLPNPTESTLITMVRNPTGGTLISNAVVADMNQNREFGSSKSLVADVYKGVEGDTVTGGNNIAQFFAKAGSRLFAGIDFVIPKGNSIAIKVDLNDSTGGLIYVALIGYLHDPNA